MVVKLWPFQAGQLHMQRWMPMPSTLRESQKPCHIKTQKTAAEDRQPRDREDREGRQGRKIWSLDWVTVEEAQGEGTGNPNPEKWERAQKTPPLPSRQRGCLPLPLVTLPCTQMLHSLFNKPR